MNLKKVCVCGHFGFGKTLLNGQTVKTKIITNELDRVLGAEQVLKLDTHGGVKALLKMSLQAFKMLKKCKNFVMLPAHNGLRILTPLLTIYNCLYKRKLHYVVIGGWLSSFINDKKLLMKQLKKFDGIHVETNTMKKSLEEMGFDNVFVMPNCKELQPLDKSQLIYAVNEPYKLCTFSRVMKEKGIENAVDAVKSVNQMFNRTVFTLDIYGQVDGDQTEWFEMLRKTFPEYITYGGLVPFDKSVEVLKDYFALLFPTYYHGEGFAGTIIDAYSAGIPVLASDWKYNSEIVEDGYTGFIFPSQNVQALVEKLIDLQDDVEKWNEIKLNCLQRANKYLPKNVVGSLIEKLA